MKKLDFNKVLDNYLITQHMTVDDYENCDDQQRRTIQELKRAFKRINKREINKIHHSLQ